MRPRPYNRLRLCQKMVISRDRLGILFCRLREGSSLAEAQRRGRLMSSHERAGRAGPGRAVGIYSAPTWAGRCAAQGFGRP